VAGSSGALAPAAGSIGARDGFEWCTRPVAGFSSGLLAQLGGSRRDGRKGVLMLSFREGGARVELCCALENGVLMLIKDWLRRILQEQ
jgi:hypothetical protein